MRAAHIGKAGAEYPRNIWHYASARLIVAASPTEHGEGPGRWWTVAVNLVALMPLEPSAFGATPPLLPS